MNAQASRLRLRPTVPRPFVVYAALTTALAAGALAALALDVGWQIDAPALFWLLSLFVLAGELLPIPVPRRHGLASGLGR